jgi:nucleoside-diphosphate-sugar epimerase
VTAPTCAITGANGLIGAAACRRFQALGWKVIALVRQPQLAPPGCETRAFALGEPLRSDLLTGIDVLVHAAYDFSLRSWSEICRINAVGSDYLFDAATRAGVKRQIFISSMAAFEGCRSKYGLCKLAGEDAARIRGGIVIRPGLIHGVPNAGLAAQIAALAKRLPVVPMIGSGRYALYTCHIDDLCELLVHVALLERPPREIITAANANPVSLRMLVEHANGDGKAPLIIAVPWGLLAGCLRLAEAAGLRIAFRSDSVVSIVHANLAPDFTALQSMPIHFRAFLDRPAWRRDSTS